MRSAKVLPSSFRCCRRIVHLGRRAICRLRSVCATNQPPLQPREAREIVTGLRVRQRVHTPAGLRHSGTRVPAGAVFPGERFRHPTWGDANGLDARRRSGMPVVSHLGPIGECEWVLLRARQCRHHQRQSQC